MRALTQGLARNRAWDHSRVMGRRVLAVDGVALVSSQSVSCAECSRRELDGAPVYAHKSVVASRASAVPTVLDWEP